MKTFKFILFQSFLILIAGWLYAQEVVVVTEEFPPYNYTENNEVVGVATKVVKVILEKAGLTYQIKSYPWARSYLLAKNEKNTLIYCISRRKKREQFFKWIGIIVPSSKSSAFALKNRDEIKITNILDLKKYQIGTTFKDARETYLLNKGFVVTDFNRVSGDDSYFRNFLKLRLKRIDVWLMPDAVMKYVVKKEGYNPDNEIRKVFEFSELSSAGYYIAASTKTSDEIVNKIRKALDDLKTSEEYEPLIAEIR
jgi:polar amino acid transport system substrate-binding protein